MNRVTYAAWGLWLAFVLTLAASIYTGMNPARGQAISVVDAIWAAAFVGFPTAGAIVVSRIPRRPLGWMLLVAPLILMVGLLLDEVARHFYDDSRLLAAWMTWGAAVSFELSLGALVAIPLFLPNGQLPSPRWTWVGRAVWINAGLLAAQAAFQPGRFVDAPSWMENPLGIEPLEAPLSFLGSALELATLAVVGAGVASLFARFRGSRGAERQQLKWLALGGAAMLMSIAVLMVIQAITTGLSQVAITLLFVFAILCLPISIAIAVMKTRLYDVDLVINKTLVYGVLSGVLALSYLSIVVVLQAVFGELVRGSDLAVAASTLAVAALFRPMRARVQDFIDRRFYRRKYDAAETLDWFSTRLRDEVDLDSLSSEIVGVVQETMQPAHASLWLRPGAAE